MTLPFWISDGGLLVVQAALVAGAATAPPPWLAQMRGRAWALVPAGSIALVIGGIAVAPGLANVLTYLALVATPLAAALAFAVIVPGARPSWALAAPALVAIAWAAPVDSLGRDIASLALTALGCLTLGWLLSAVAPIRLLKLGIVAAACLDSVLVFGHLLQGPNATLNAAAPAAHLPQLQFVEFGSAVMGYGDLFIAGVLAGVLVVERARQLPVALACLAIAAAFDLLFFVRSDLPATVPVAAALVVSELTTTARRAASGGYAVMDQKVAQ